MKYARILFSPTGGTLRTAEAVTGVWPDEVETVDLTDPASIPRSFRREDLVLIAVPSFGGRVPSLAAQRLAGIEGNQAACVLLCVYGNRAYEDTLAELRDLAEQQNFRVLAAIAAIAEHSILRQYAAGRPDAQDGERLGEFSQAVLEKFRSGNETAPALPGNRPYKQPGRTSLVPKAGKGCTACGLCARQCPAQAIRLENLQTAENALCISCMRCVARCPQGVRRVNRAMTAVAAQALRKACSVRKECELFI